MLPDPDGRPDTSLYLKDNTVAFKFLDFLFDSVTNSFIEFKYFSPGRRHKIAGRSTYLSIPLEHERVKSEVLNSHSDQTIMVGLAPRCRVPAGGRAGRNQDVLQVGCVWAGIDYQRAPGGAIDVLRRMQDLPLRPSVVVNTGYGYDVYFIFHTQLRAAELLVWSELIGKLRTVLRVSQKAELGEVMRLPGTLNTDEAHPVACEICEGQSSWTRYSVEEMRGALDRSAANASPGPHDGTLPHAGTFDKDLHSAEALRRRGVPTDLVETIITGRVGGASGRGAGGESGRDLRIASVLLKSGLSEEEIKNRPLAKVVKD
jgi:hypothetical protein